MIRKKAFDQAWVGTERPTEERFEGVTNRANYPIKPNGGLWTSTLNRDAEGTYTSAWLRWMEAEHFGFEEGLQLYSLAFDESFDGELYHIDSVGDLQRLCDQYGRLDNDLFNRLTMAAIDFEQFDRETDFVGMYLTKRGQRETHFGTPSLNGWDCECTLFTEWVFDDITHVRAIEKPDLAEWGNR
jgi:hypothetical protein